MLINRTLSEILDRLRYRVLTDLIGREVTVSEFETVERDVVSSLVPQLAGTIHLSEPSTRDLSLQVVKYGILDLTFGADALALGPEDTVSPLLLEELGFIGKNAEDMRNSDLLENKEDPTCMQELQEEVRAYRTFLRLFLNSESTETMKQRMVRLMPLLAREDSESAFLSSVASEFPRTFIVEDACLTNASFVWFHTHFHL